RARPAAGGPRRRRPPRPPRPPRAGGPRRVPPVPGGLRNASAGSGASVGASVVERLPIPEGASMEKRSHPAPSDENEGLLAENRRLREELERARREIEELTLELEEKALALANSRSGKEEPRPGEAETAPPAS